jgi:rod shape determining protein RodA
MTINPFHRNPELTLGQKALQINWGLVLIICGLAAVGCIMLYSAANGEMQPWAARQAIRFAPALVMMLIIALIDIRFLFRWTWLIYFGALALLIGVEVMGTIGMGAQRWIDLYVMRLQPSEIMKVALVMALARYFHGLSEEDIGRPMRLIPALLMILAPVGLVLKQPDLGTAGILIMIAGAIFFAAGVRLWKFAVVGGLAAGAIPIAWQFLHGYQKQRILTFLDPSSDPLGSGYHITQSKIALGAGGLFGKGFLQGSQSHLNFLPEKQTDFIFTMLAEEFGMVGALGLIGLYVIVIFYGFMISLRARNHFGRLMAIGLTLNIFLYVFINIAMVMGLIPVVGVPLPLISYGGTAMLAVMISFGLMISIHVHREVRIPRRGLENDE